MPEVVASDLIYIQASRTLRPEDIESTAGSLFLRCLERIRDGPHCAALFWGRSEEDPNLLGVVIRKRHATSNRTAWEPALTMT